MYPHPPTYPLYLNPTSSLFSCPCYLDHAPDNDLLKTNHLITVSNAAVHWVGVWVLEAGRKLMAWGQGLPRGCPRGAAWRPLLWHTTNYHHLKDLSVNHRYLHRTGNMNISTPHMQGRSRPGWGRGGRLLWFWGSKATILECRKTQWPWGYSG